MQNIKLTRYILISLVLGIIVGVAFPAFAVKLSPLAMIIAPLLFATLVIGIAGHGDIKSLGKIGFKTIIYFEIVTIAALLIGLGIGHFTQPGAGLSQPANISSAYMDAVTAMGHSSHHASLTQLVIDILS